jgi:biopolymer transport protein ExbD
MHRHHTATVHKAPKKLDSVRSDINVTPLVDVCLVLLIIFLVVADQLTKGHPVNLPKTKNHEEVRQSDNDLIISVARDKSGVLRFWWDRDQLRDKDELKQKLEDSFHKKARPLFFKADADLKYGDVYPILMDIHEAGAPEVQLSTNDQKGGE